MSNSIRKWIFVLAVPAVIVLILGIVGTGAGHGVPLQSANIDLDDAESTKWRKILCKLLHGLSFA